MPKLERSKVKELALRAGFAERTQPDQRQDLNAYVYDFADAIAEEASKPNKEFIDLVWGAVHTLEAEGYSVLTAELRVFLERFEK